MSFLRDRQILSPTKELNKLAILELCRVGITKQTVMITRMQMIRPDILTLLTPAPFFNPLPPVLLKRKPATIQLHKQIIWNTRAS